MDDYKQLLANLLSDAIRDQKTNPDKYLGIDWKSIYEEAAAHQVHSLLFPVLKLMNADQCIDGNSFSKWRNDILQESVTQIQNIERMSNILDVFNEAGIPVIALKGLVLRKLYPYPELRIMTDTDILVHKEDIARAKSLLLQMGYFISNIDSKHIRFSHKDYLPIELHRSLVYQEIIKNAVDFENAIWENATPSKVCDIPVLVLCAEDQVLHLCLHMASHLISSGFGLRQLCDLVLFVESKRDVIDWDHFCKRAQNYGIYKFVIMIFLVCKQLLDMEIPQDLYFSKLENDNGVELLIEYIYSCGVFGKRTEVRRIASIQSHFIEPEDYNRLSGKLKRSVSLLFPSSKRLGVRYAFVRKYPLLTPAAWIHRFIRGIFRKDLMLSEKVAFLFPSKASMTLLDERAKLLHWLDLR